MKLGGFPERIWRSRLQRVAFLLLAGLALATNVRPGPLPPDAGAADALLTFAPVPLDPENPRRRQIGGLRFLGGWALTSDNPRFGGISAMHVEAGRVTAISDAGTLMHFPLPAGRRHARVRLEPLPAGPGPAIRKSNRDSEAMLIRGDQVWVAFERYNMIWKYRRSDMRVLSSAQPRAIRRWSANGGTEAMVRLPDGRFLLFAEGPSNGRPFSNVGLFAGDPAVAGTPAARLRYRRPEGLRVTDAAVLPDGRLLLLNRRFSWWDGLSATLALADVEALSRGAIIEGREVAALRPPLSVDNMEALSVTVENGRTIVWIASDDNFIPLQRTLLLKFELVG